MASCGHYTSYLPTLPSRGTMRSGVIYEQVMSEPHIRDKEYSLLPTPAVAHTRNHDEPIENYLQRRQDYTDGKTKGMPGASLGVAVRLMKQGKNIDGTVDTEESYFGSGKYEQTLLRWERLSRRVMPSLLNDDELLNEDFVAWMMGLPEGWLDADGVTRKDKMILLGNGVVPRQAYHAISQLFRTIGV